MILRVTGLILMIGPASFGAFAQEYIDVEAERKRAQQSGNNTAQPTRVSPIDPAPSADGARSFGLDSQPAPTTYRQQQGIAPPAEQQNVGDIFVQLQELQQEVMRLNGIVEEQANEIRVLKEQSLERYMDLDRRLSGGGGVAAAPLGSGSGAQNAESRPSGDAGGAGGAEQPGEGDAYRAAYSLVRSQEFDAAVRSFKQFLDEYPDGRYAPNAHYWLGELYLVIKPPATELARQSFTLLLEEYPRNAKVPDAMYKLGQVHYVKGNRDQAKDFLNRVIREHGNSAAANLAREFLEKNF